MLRLFLMSMVLFVAVSAFAGSEDRFIKKYAMMKIYESCFGPEVVKQIRKEMKAACAKCASPEGPVPLPVPTAAPAPLRPPVRPPMEEQPQDGIVDPQNSVYANQQAYDQIDKIQQAILAYRPNVYQTPAYRPFPNVNQPGYYPQFATPQGGYYPGYPQANPFAAAPYVPYMAQPYYGNSRMSRDMDIRGQLEALTSRMSGRVKNVTCVMQELGYLDENLQPNFEKISDRIGKLPVQDELKRDMQDGVTFCQQFSQCVPEVNKFKSPLSRELIRPMFFFKCYKHKKLEACIMKDVREKFSGVSDEELDEPDVELRRTGKANRMQEGEIDDLATSMYEFLYGSDSNVDLDSIL